VGIRPKYTNVPWKLLVCRLECVEESAQYLGGARPEAVYLAA